MMTDEITSLDRRPAASAALLARRAGRRESLEAVGLLAGILGVLVVLATVLGAVPVWLT